MKKIFPLLSLLFLWVTYTWWVVFIQWSDIVTLSSEVVSQIWWYTTNSLKIIWIWLIIFFGFLTVGKLFEILVDFEVWPFKYFTRKPNHRRR